MNKIRERKLTPSLLRYLETHFSIVGFIDGPIIQCSDGNPGESKSPINGSRIRRPIAYVLSNELSV